MMNPLKELLETSPKVIAKFIFDVVEQLEKLDVEYRKLQAKKNNAPEYDVKIEMDKVGGVCHTDSKMSFGELELKYRDLWRKHQELLRSIQ